METTNEREFLALAPAGFEAALGDELKSLGCRRVRPLRGSVSFFGDAPVAYRACLWSRLASRILVALDRVDAADPDGLYESCSSIPWEDHVGPGATIAVDVRGSSGGIPDTRYATLRVKDAVCDRLRSVRGDRPFVDTDSPDVRVVCMLRPDRATLFIDMSGGMIDHGYRVPMRGRGSVGRGGYVREDMAALMLEMVGWTAACKRTDGCRLVDPIGSSATLIAEAACVAADRAPGLARKRWGFSGWLGHDGQAWESELSRALERFESGRSGQARVVCAVPDPAVRVELSDMLERVALSGTVDVQACGPGGLDLGDGPIRDAFVVCSLPDGPNASMGELPVRLAAVNVLARGPQLAEAPICCLEAGGMLASALGMAPDRVHPVMNGSSEASIEVFPSPAQAARRSVAAESPDAPALEGIEALRAAGQGGALHRIELADGTGVDVLVESSDQFAARLARVARIRGKWARKSGVSCYRVYDADLPDYAVSVDLYEGSAQTPGRWLVVSEYSAPRGIDPDLARRRLADALTIAPRVMDVDPANVFLKVRRREKGGSQYAGHLDEKRTAIVEEGGLSFEVNLSDYLDTGLFLDNRDVRGIIREMAPRARFLNLFAYTGTATCYAAAGGAYRTTTVDLSNTYLDWARRNMEQNGFTGEDHEFVQADVMPWISEQRRTNHRWNLIYIDPPTFSNSSRMRARGFDVQEDHAELIIGASRLLIRGGTILFCCNMRGFEPDVEKLARAGVELRDITERTIPADFARNARPHHCYLAYRAD